MKKLLILLLFISTNTYCQNNKQGNQWVNWNTIIDLNSNIANTINPNNYIFRGNSSICDSNGLILLHTNGFSIFNKNGIVANGGMVLDSAIVDSIGWDSGQDQGSIILPKKNNTYYIFTPTVSASEIYRSWINPKPDSISFRFDELLYCIVDMNANNGDGLVTQKKIPLLQNT